MPDRRTFVAVLCLMLGLGCERANSGPDEPPVPTRAPRPIFSLAPPRPPEGPASPQPDIVLFLPFVNRTADRIHPGLVRTFDRTLAAFSAVFLGLRPVDPELAATLAHSAGLPGPDAVGSDAVPSDLGAVARRVGAGIAVWGELLPGARVALHAQALVPGADATPWNIAPIDLHGTRDAAWYDGPHQLLATVANSPGAVERLAAQAHAEPAHDTEALQAAVAKAASGDPVQIRRAEEALAAVAAAQPHWGAPWLELFALRARRLTHENDARRLAEGPGPARHIVHLLDLDNVERARLEALDWSFTGHERPVSDLDALVARLPASAWERVHLARGENDLSRERFGLDRVETSTGTERAVLAATRTAHVDEARRAVKEIAAELPAEEVLRSAYFVNVFIGEAENRGDWGAEAALNLARARLRGAESLEVLRGACASLDTAARRSCQAPLAQMVSGRVEGFGEPSLDDDAAWDVALATWLGAEIETPAARLVTVPDDSLFAENPTFAEQWIASGDLVLAANRSLAARDSAAQGLLPAARLLVSPERIRLHAALDEMLFAAYWHADLKARRGEHAEAKDYLAALRPFSSFATSRFLHARIREKNNFKEAAAAAYTELAKQDPYDPRWLGPWLSYVDFKEKVAWDDSSTAREAEWLGTLVPQTFAIAQNRIRTWRDAGRNDRALEVLEAYERQRRFPEFALVRDEMLAELGRPSKERLANLEAAYRVRSREINIVKQLVELQIRSRRYGEAERTVRPLLDRATTLEYACAKLAELAAWQGQPERGGEAIASCIEKAPDKWVAARLWNRYGRGLRDRDRFAEALAAYGEAQELVGGAAWIVDNVADAHALLGDHEQARQHYTWVKEHYGEGKEDDASGRAGLYWLSLREKDPQAARAEIAKVAEHARHNEQWWVMLGDTYAREGRLGEFLALCRGRTEDQGPQLALVHYHRELGEYDEALRLLDSVIADNPKDHGWMRRKAALLLEANRPQEALALAEQALDHDREDSGAAETTVDSLLALGRVSEAHRRAADFAEQAGETSSVLYMNAKVARREGDTRLARQLMSRGRQVVSWGEYPWSEEADWLIFEVSLGIPPAGSREIGDLEHRIERALRHEFSTAELWQALADVRERAGNPTGAGAARTEVEYLTARLEAPQRVASQ